MATRPMRVRDTSRSPCKSSRPSATGIQKSNSTTSGRNVSTASSPTAPLRAVRTSKPAWVRARAALSMDAASSSTTSTLPSPDGGPPCSRGSPRSPNADATESSAPILHPPCTSPHSDSTETPPGGQGSKRLAAVLDDRGSWTLGLTKHATRRNWLRLRRSAAGRSRAITLSTSASIARGATSVTCSSPTSTLHPVARGAGPSMGGPPSMGGATSSSPSARGPGSTSGRGVASCASKKPLSARAAVRPSPSPRCDAG